MYGNPPMDDCIFCRIAQHQMPADITYEDELVMAFNDINPKAPIHQLIIPKIHIESLAHLQPQHHDLMAHLTLLIPQLAKKSGLNNGFKIQVHSGKGGGQEVFHLHYHLMGAPK